MILRSNASKIASVSFQSLQLLQFSGLLEAQARKLRRDALRLQTAALCGTATTNFLDIMESFFGVEEDEDEAKLDDAASMAAFVRANKEERARDAKSKDFAISKEVIESEEVDVEEDEMEETESVVSTSSQPSRSQSRPKKAQSKKYPTKCRLSEAQLFYPTSADSLHETGVDAKYIGSRENLSEYKGLYCCLFGNCEYGAQVRGNTYSHIRRVHLGAAFGCRFCPAQAWWQARSWSNHMDSAHPDQAKYEDVQLPSGPLEGVKIEPELFIEQESFTIPVPKAKPTSKVNEPSAKRPKREPTGLLSYEDWEEASKEGELYLLADSPNPNQPRPKAAAIRYRYKPAGGISAEFVPDVSSSQDNPATVQSTLSIDPNVVPDSAFDNTVEVTGTYNIES